MEDPGKPNLFSGSLHPVPTDHDSVVPLLSDSFPRVGPAALLHCCRDHRPDPACLHYSQLTRTFTFSMALSLTASPWERFSPIS